MSDVKREVTQHGIKWINNNPSQVYCPECNSNMIEYEIGFDHKKYIGEIIWVATCKCTMCSCEWKITRTEKVPLDW